MLSDQRGRKEPLNGKRSVADCWSLSVRLGRSQMPLYDTRVGKTECSKQATIA